MVRRHPAACTLLAASLHSQVDGPPCAGCFRDINSFAEALEEIGTCGNVARRALGTETNLNNLHSECHVLGTEMHLCYGLRYYVGRIISGLEDPSRNVSIYLTHQETLEKDVAHIADWLRVPASNATLGQLRVGMCVTLHLRQFARRTSMFHFTVFDIWQV